MIRILHVIATLGRGGAERQLVNVVTRSNPKEFQHFVCHLTQPDAYKKEIENAGHRVFSLNLNHARSWLKASRKLRPILKEYHPHLFHSWMVDGTLTTRILNLLGTRIPNIVSLQNADYDPANIAQANWPPLKMEIFRWLERLTDHIGHQKYVACSHYVSLSTQQRLRINKERIKVIYNSVDATTLSDNRTENLRQRLKISDRTFVFLNVGRLDPQKGQSTLLQAFHQALPKMPNSLLLIVGQGGQKQNLMELAAKLNLNRSVKFLGQQKQMGEIFAIANSFVFPSTFEGFSVALVEAMLKGLPCIASGLLPNKEAICDQQDGLIVPPGSVEGLAHAMLTLYENPNLRFRLAVAAKQKANQQFSSFPHIIPQWENLYRQSVATA